jgi:hypothetical protein
VVAGALEGDSVLKFWSIRCDFAMTLVARSVGKTLGLRFRRSRPARARSGRERGEAGGGHPRVAFVAAGGEENGGPEILEGGSVVRPVATTALKLGPPISWVRSLVRI